MGLARRVIAVLASVALLTGVGATAASAAPAWANDDFGTVCADDACIVGVWGTIVWGNRTASITGEAVDVTSEGYSTIFFDGFAGARKVDSVSFGAYKPGTEFGPFPIGDPNLRGGIDRVRITICWEGSWRQCSQQWNEIRD